MLFDALSLFCVAVIGFVAHRASLCNVRAVAEIMTTGRAHMLWSLTQAVLWMATLTGVLVVGLGLLPQPALARSPLGWAVVGGCLFGIGAAVNGGCSLSTLQRLADGDLGMLAALMGFALGVSTWTFVPAGGGAARLDPVASPWLRWPELAPWLLPVLLAWVLLRLIGFGRLARSSGMASLRQRLLAPTYHLSVAAAVLGLAGGLLFATQGNWSYTNFLRTGVLHLLGDAPALTLWHGVLVGGLMIGMVASALQRRSLAWRWPPRALDWLRHTAGGVLMGAGAAMVPGGNDTLLLSGLPGLTTAALASYVAMLLAIAAVMEAMRRARIPLPAIVCTPWGCDGALASADGGSNRSQANRIGGTRKA